MEVITAIVAVYGAIVSTILAAKDFIYERRRIKVECNITVVHSRLKGVDKYISITAINIGHRPVQLIMAGLLLSNNNQFTQLKNGLGPISLPKKLEDGDTVTIYLEEKVVLNAITGFISKGIKYSFAYVKDAEGNIYKTSLPNWFTENNIG